MKEKKIFILASIILFLLIIILLIYNNNNKSRLYEINTDEVIEKVNNKESFILCISATYCDHCNSYKPKLEKISKKYQIDIYYLDYDKYSSNKQEEFRNYISFDGGTPVTLFINEGIEKTTVNRINGNVSEEKIIEKFKNNGFIK